MDKTVKELAEQYGVSKQAITYHIKKVPKEYKKFDTKNGVKILVVNEQGQEMLDSMLSNKNNSLVPNLLPKDELQELKHQIEILELEKEMQSKSLHEKVELIQAELDKRNKEIDNLITLLDQEQRLHAMAESKVKMLEDFKAEVEAEKKEAQQKRSLWSKLFNRRETVTNEE